MTLPTPSALKNSCTRVAWRAVRRKSKPWGVLAMTPMLAEAPLSPLRAWAISARRILSMSDLQDLDLRSQGGAVDERWPIAEDFADGGAAFGVAGDALGAAGDERGEL